MRVFIITGAGISAESGIPTFRGKDGYWRNLDPASLATPEAFERDPKLVWEWYHERRQRIRSAKPNAAHDAIVKLARRSHGFLLVTQNVDDLHARASCNGEQLSTEHVVQVHGEIFLTRCSRCAFARRELERDSSELPRCAQCNALMRPGVVWFGEQLDPHEITRVENFLAKEPCDAVIVIGTTATFGYIIDWALRARGKAGRLVEINPDETALSPFATEIIREPAAAALPRLVQELTR